MVKEGIFNIFRSLSDLVFQRTCLVCGRTLLANEDVICIYCRADLPLTHFEYRSHNPMADRLNAVLQRILDEEGCDGFERYYSASALFFYNSFSGYKAITRSLKYNGDIRSGRYFSKLMGKQLASSELFSDIDIVMPIPLHLSRKWSRGYNQAEIVAKEVAESLSASLVTSILGRTARTRSQTKLSIGDKYYNVRNAFSVDNKRLLSYISRITPSKKAHILLIDDVFTTGATSGASTFALCKALSELSISDYRISVATLGFVCNV